MPWCPEHLYLETAKKTKCVTTSGDRLTRQVVLKFGAYPNSAAVPIDYTIKLSGDWKLIPLTKPNRPATPEKKLAR